MRDAYCGCEEMRNEYETAKPRGEPKHCWRDNIKMHLRSSVGIGELALAIRVRLNVRFFKPLRMSEKQIIY
jgi:hypothetical protein